MRMNFWLRQLLSPPPQTHEGAQAVPLAPEPALRRSVLACLLWENEFYENGETIADRIVSLVGEVAPETVAALAVEARESQRLRHAPLLLVSALAMSRALAGQAGGKLVEDTVCAVVQRADELAELLAIHARVNHVAPNALKKILPAAMKRGLARAFGKFDAYQLAKYDRAGAVRLRDVLFLTHPRPKDEAQAAVWKQLAEGALAAPDTWEVALSGGADKRETFERLLREKRLGYLALLRNLRNMEQAGCDGRLVRAAIVERRGAERVLPFRYVAAARAAPQFEPALDKALRASLAGGPQLAGRTVVLVDVSGSMEARLSARSDLTRLDAAATLASVIYGGKLRVFTFSERVTEVAARRGIAGVDAIRASQPHGGTRLIEAVSEINRRCDYDRLIVVTDEQAWGAPEGTARLPDPKGRGYVINVASARNGVGYGAWTHIDGFSENVLRYVFETEQG